MPDVFISYRRNDAAGWAGRLCQELKDDLPSYNIFMDIDSIEFGLDYEEVIDRMLDKCDLMLVMIGPHWLTSTDQDGKRRIDDPDDLVRIEISKALGRRVRVIPILVGGASMPSAAELPEDLRKLTRRNAYDFSDRRWKYDKQQFVEALRRYNKNIPETSIEPPERMSHDDAQAAPQAAPATPVINFENTRTVASTTQPKPDNRPQELEQVQTVDEVVPPPPNQTQAKETPPISRPSRAADRPATTWESAQTSYLRPDAGPPKFGNTKIDKKKLHSFIVDEISRASIALQSDTVYVKPNIDPKKLANARAKCTVPEDEIVLALIDATVFGSAKDCVLFTTAGLRNRYMSSPIFIGYNNFKSLTFSISGGNILASGKIDGKQISYEIELLTTCVNIVDLLRVLESVKNYLEFENR